MKSVVGGSLGALFLAGCSGPSDSDSLGASSGAATGTGVEHRPETETKASPAPSSPPPRATTAPSSPPAPPPPAAGVTCTQTITTYPSIGGSICDSAAGTAVVTTETNVPVTRDVGPPSLLCLTSTGLVHYALQPGPAVCLWPANGGGSAQDLGTIAVSGGIATVSISGGRSMGVCKTIFLTCSGKTTIHG